MEAILGIFNILTSLRKLMEQFEYSSSNRDPSSEPHCSTTPAGGKLQPTPINELIPPSKTTAGSAAFEYNADSNGKLKIEERPGCVSICFMIPYPFFCGGCCYAVSCDLIFDDSSQTFNITSWPGFLCCFAKSRSHIEYTHIGNFALEESCCMLNRSTMYFPMIVLKDGTKLYIGDSELLRNVGPKLLALHRFIFGRSNPNYVVPDVKTLIVT